MEHCDFAAIEALLRRHGFHFSKSMGQNFLIDASIPAAIAEASEAGEGNGVLEIGPGIGALSHELCRRAGRVVAVELDKALLPILDETMANFDNFEAVSADILKTDNPALVREKLAGLTPIVCANLPYNITTPAITALLESKCFESITVLVQKEVAGLKALGVKVETNMVIGRVVSIDELMSQYGFEAVFIGSGAGLPMFMHIPGENLCGVYSANEFLTRINLMKAY